MGNIYFLCQDFLFFKGGEYMSEFSSWFESETSLAKQVNEYIPDSWRVLRVKGLGSVGGDIVGYEKFSSGEISAGRVNCSQDSPEYCEWNVNGVCTAPKGNVISRIVNGYLNLGTKIIECGRTDPWSNINLE